MNKTNTFFVISNFNTDPEQYLEYCKDYIIYDQSTNVEIKTLLRNKNLKIEFVENTGHNISDYFRFFIDNYNSLPQFIMLLKGNIIGRHVTEEFFNRVYTNQYYTLLFEAKSFIEKHMVSYQLYDGAFLEINNAWYSKAKEYKYFKTYDELLKFVFKNPIISKWLMFSPGGCHIVTKEQVNKYPPIFYENLKFLVSYKYFPSEAYHVERMLNIIFTGSYELNEHMLDHTKFKQALQHVNMQCSSTENSISRKFKYVKEIYQRWKYVFNV